MNQPNSVTCVLCNEGIQVAKALQFGSPSSYTNFANHNFEYEINEIGYDWKTFDMGSFSYIIDNSRCYFIKDFDNNIFRIYFTEFEGSSTGKISFNMKTTDKGFLNTIFYRLSSQPSRLYGGP